ncbi:glycosyltransferase family 2 protein [Pinibacter aurantiacus]|uniref:Glycosyltransferase n=1 Tax=Pinibacter aurantiacus TaxID=2851599 RepID=A0A9E2S6J8_9BACT|nr:glycosyltransferase family 2 protein [Pinibacter aurantiacus]MBV4356068.1 glycosyltransferase [Pinibacter aurantiacus]
MLQPLVSVLMTCYNREKYIGEAIESVLNSTYKNFELIIVDDGSKDATVSIAKSYAMKDERISVYVNDENLGDYPNRNRAASYAKGKYLKYVDSDDLLYKHSIQVYVDFMETYPNVGYAVISAHNSTLQPFPHILKPTESIRTHFFKRGFLDCAPTGVIYRTDVFRELGSFSGARMIGDIEMGLKIALQYDVMILPPGLVFWREHGAQEFFIGIKNNMYPPLMKSVLLALLSDVDEKILTQKELQKIIKTQTHTSVIGKAKRIIKSIVRK